MVATDPPVRRCFTVMQAPHRIVLRAGPLFVVSLGLRLANGQATVDGQGG